MDNQKIKQVNVTNLTPKQRRQIITDAMNQKGFIGYIKNEHNNQTHYTIHYKN